MLYLWICNICPHYRSKGYNHLFTIMKPAEKLSVRLKAPTLYKRSFAISAQRRKQCLKLINVFNRLNSEIELGCFSFVGMR